MPSRSLSYAKIMQSECRTTSLLDCYAEVKLILCKDTSKQSQRQKITFKYEDYKFTTCPQRTFRLPMLTV